MTKVLFLVPYPPGEAPSQRFRFEQYLDLLSVNNIEYKVQPFLSSSDWRVFYRNDNLSKKALALLSGFFRRLKALAIAPKYDFIFVHREAAPLGPPLLEWTLAFILRRKIIYDFDDAIWVTDEPNEGLLYRLLKWRSKIGRICRWSYKVSCGNEFLCSYASQFSSSVLLIPTTLDTDSIHIPSKKRSWPDGSLSIGWTGSHSTLKYLNALEGVLNKLFGEFPSLRIRVIADREPQLNVPNLEFVKWNKETEIEDLLQIDIGIMPLPDDEWSRGKCGFKALQYMALEIPAVVSPVGVNSAIVRNGVDGFLAENDSAWLTSLSKLLKNPDLRQQMGKNGRQRVIESYSVSANASRFLSLFS